MPKEYTVEALCNSWKCQGARQTFKREVEHEPFSYDSTPIGVRLPEWLSEKACCANCGTDVHIPVTDEERHRYSAERRKASEDQARENLERVLRQHGVA